MRARKFLNSPLGGYDTGMKPKRLIVLLVATVVGGFAGLICGTVIGRWLFFAEDRSNEAVRHAEDRLSTIIILGLCLGAVLSCWAADKFLWHVNRYLKFRDLK